MVPTPKTQTLGRHNTRQKALDIIMMGWMRFLIVFASSLIDRWKNLTKGVSECIFSIM